MMMAVMSIMLVLPVKTEAATVTVLPLVNNVAEYSDMNATYYANAFDAVKDIKGWEMVDSEEIEKYTKDSVQEGQIAGKDVLKEIAEKANVDVVIAMQLDTLKERYVHSQEDYLLLNMQGVCLSYNRINDKFVKHDFSEEGRFEPTEGNRWDWKRQEFSKAVKREINRTLGKKKISVERPRITKL